MRKTIVDVVVSFWSQLTRSLPEAQWKHCVRLIIYKFKPFLHKEFLVNRGDIAVLVGSPRPDIVETTLRIVGPKGRVVLIEADPTNIKTHKAHFELHPYPNLDIVPRALSSERGRGIFLLASAAMDHRLLIDGIDMDNDYIADNYYVDQIEVPIDTMDSVAAELQLNRIDYIEITVNGAELYVLKGMTAMLSQTQRLFVKAHAIKKDTGKPLSHEIVPFLRARGFETFITKPSQSSAMTKAWGLRQGDVYAWRIRPVKPTR